jgi:tRNA(Ile)-lysidine synthetase-like protein
LVRFGELRLGPPAAPAPPYALPLAVPGEVSLPEGRALVSRPARGPARVGAERAVVAWPAQAGPLLVRTRRPGDRVFVKGKAMSLKRFFLERRVPVDARGRLPLVASGPDVLFGPGLGLESRPARRFLRLEVRG